MGKITEEELKQVSDLKQQTTQVLYALGELEYQRISLDIVAEDLKKTVKEIKEREVAVITELKNKYGNVNINIETGEF